MAVDWRGKNAFVGIREPFHRALKDWRGNAKQYCSSVGMQFARFGHIIECNVPTYSSGHFAFNSYCSRHTDDGELTDVAEVAVLRYPEAITKFDEH